MYAFVINNYWQNLNMEMSLSSKHNSFVHLNYNLMTELLFGVKILSSGDNLNTGNPFVHLMDPFPGCYIPEILN